MGRRKGGAAAGRPRGERPGLVDRLTGLVVVLFLAALAVPHLVG